MKKTKLIALFAAIAATVLVYLLLVKSTPDKVSEITYREVVAAGVNIPKGSRISGNMLTIVKIPEETVISQMFTEPENIIDSVAAVDIMAKQTIMSNYLTGQTGAAYSIPKDMRAATLIMDLENGVAGLIRPGDNIDLLFTYRSPVQTEGNTETERDVFSQTSSYMLENIKVLAVSSQVWNDPASEDGQPEAGRDGSSVMLTLLVTPEQAVTLEGNRFYEKRDDGNIRILLRSPEDEGINGGLQYDLTIVK